MVEFCRQNLESLVAGYYHQTDKALHQGLRVSFQLWILSTEIQHGSGSSHFFYVNPALFSNLYMEIFRLKFLSSIIPMDAKWFCFVNEIICRRPKVKASAIFLPWLSNLMPSLRFSCEEENEINLPFLDTVVHRHMN